MKRNVIEQEILSLNDARNSSEDQIFIDNRKALKDYRTIIRRKKKTNTYTIDSAALHSHYKSQVNTLSIKRI